MMGSGHGMFFGSADVGCGVSLSLVFGVGSAGMEGASCGGMFSGIAGGGCSDLIVPWKWIAIVVTDGGVF